MKIKKSLSTANLMQIKPGAPVKIADDRVREVIGETAEQRGCWIIYGKEKNGKTAFALQLAKILAEGVKVNYISAEEGFTGSFTESVERAGITTGKHCDIVWDKYLTYDEIVSKLRKQRSAKITFIDNLTVYNEMTPKQVRDLEGMFPSKLIIFMAHEERGEAYPATGKMAKKLARVIFHVVGLKVFVTSRYGAGGGTIEVNKEMSGLFWGNDLNEE